MELGIGKKLCRISQIVLKNVSKGQSVNQRVKIICDTLLFIYFSLLWLELV